MHKIDNVQVKQEVMDKKYTLLSFDELPLFVRIWKSAEKPKAVILIVHSFGEHSGRYNTLARKFVECGFYVISFDMRGHGNSGGKRGQSTNYNKLLKDLEIICHQVDNEFFEIPKILYGHSFGGNLAINFSIVNLCRFSGIIISSPWLKLEFQLPRLIFLLGSIFSHVFPNMISKTGLDPDSLSRNPEVISSYKNDPLVHDKISLRLFMQIVESGIKASGSIYKINAPLLVMHGSADKITSFKATQNFVMNASSKTTFKEWPENYHELHNDLNSEEVFDFTVDWLNKILSVNN